MMIAMLIPTKVVKMIILARKLGKATVRCARFVKLTSKGEYNSGAGVHVINICKPRPKIYGALQELRMGRFRCHICIKLTP